MANQTERRAYRKIEEAEAAVYGKKLSMDFAKIVRTIDLGNDDDKIAEIGNKQLKDD